MDEDSLKKEVSYLRDELGVSNLLLEKYITGEDYRVQVVGSEVVGAVRRVPANIIGNGTDPIYKLIEDKNKLRKKNPHLRSRLIKIDREVKKNIVAAGYCLESVPKSGELIYLRGNANLSTGGDSIEVTDDITDALKETAVRAVQSIPNLLVAGVDIIFDKENGLKDPGVVIEINGMAQLGSLLFPSKGYARDGPSAIIDYLFPESCRYKLENRNLYYNYKSVVQAVKNGVATEVTLKKPPSGNVMARKIIISGVVQGVGFRKWAKTKALKMNLSGYAKNLKSGKLLIVIYGTQEEIDNFLNSCYRGPQKAIVNDVEVFEWKNSVMAGFEIKNLGRQKKEIEKVQKQSKKEIDNLQKQLKAKKSELKEMRSKYKQIKQSKIWRYTKPLRKLKKFFMHVMEEAIGKK